MASIQNISQSFDDAIVLPRSGKTTETTFSKQLKIALRYGKENKDRVEMLLMLPPKSCEVHIEIARSKSFDSVQAATGEEEAPEMLAGSAPDPGTITLNKMAQIVYDCRMDLRKVLLTSLEAEYILLGWKKVTEGESKGWVGRSNGVLDPRKNFGRSLTNTCLQSILLTMMGLIWSIFGGAANMRNAPFYVLEFRNSQRTTSDGYDSARLFQALLAIYREIDSVNLRRETQTSRINIELNDSTEGLGMEQDLIPFNLELGTALRTRLRTKIENILHQRSINEDTGRSMVQEIHSVDDADLEVILDEIRKLIRRFT